MFRGRYEHSLDAKGRLALPAAFKKLLAARGDEQLVVTAHISSACLVAYPEAEWRQFEARLAQLPQFEPSVMLMRRLYVGSAMDCAVDKQGRVLVPPVLREPAGITKEAFWVGAMNTMEIWAPDAWAKQVESARAEVGPEVLAKLGELGL